MLLLMRLVVVAIVNANGIAFETRLLLIGHVSIVAKSSISAEKRGDNTHTQSTKHLCVVEGV